MTTNRSHFPFTLTLTTTVAGAIDLDTMDGVTFRALGNNRWAATFTTPAQLSWAVGEIIDRSAAFGESTYEQPSQWRAACRAALPRLLDELGDLAALLRADNDDSIGARTIYARQRRLSDAIDAMAEDKRLRAWSRAGRSFADYKWTR